MVRSFDPAGSALEAFGLREEALKLIASINVRWPTQAALARAHGERLAGMLDRVGKDLLQNEAYNPTEKQVEWLRGVAEGSPRAPARAPNTALRGGHRWNL